MKLTNNVFIPDEIKDRSLGMNADISKILAK